MLTHTQNKSRHLANCKLFGIVLVVQIEQNTRYWPQRTVTVNKAILGSCELLRNQTMSSKVLCCSETMLPKSCCVAEEPALHVSRSWASWLVFYWVNPLMARGSKRQLQAADLFSLPTKLLPSTCSNLLWQIWAAVWLSGSVLCSCVRTMFVAVW